MSTRERFAKVPIGAATLSLSGRAWRVLIAIGSHADKDGRAWPSLSTIARCTGIARKNIGPLIAELIRSRAISKEDPQKGSRVNVYRIADRIESEPTADVLNPEDVETTTDALKSEDTADALESEDTADTDGLEAEDTEASNPRTGCPQDQVADVLKSEAQTYKGTYKRTDNGTDSSRVREGDGDVPSEPFDRFWEAYPRRFQHGEFRFRSEQVFADIVADGVDPELLIAGAGRYARERQDQDPKFTATAAGWLAARRWLDNPDEARVDFIAPGPGSGMSRGLARFQARWAAEDEQTDDDVASDAG